MDIRRRESSPRDTNNPSNGPRQKKLEPSSDKTSPKTNSNNRRIVISFPRSRSKARLITIDHIDSFSKIGSQSRNGMQAISEKTIKKAFAKIIGERGRSKIGRRKKRPVHNEEFALRARELPTAIAFQRQGNFRKACPWKDGQERRPNNRLFEERLNSFSLYTAARSTRR